MAAATDHLKAGELLGFGPFSNLKYLTCLLDHPDYTLQIYGMAGLRGLPREDRLPARPFVWFLQQIEFPTGPIPTPRPPLERLRRASNPEGL